MFKCGKCKKSFATKAGLKQHEKRKIPCDLIDDFSCVLCAKIFSTKAGLKQHENKKTPCKIIEDVVFQLPSKDKEVKVEANMQVSNATVAEGIFDAINKAFMFESKKFRTIIVGEEIWFCGKDIATLLEYTNTRKAIQDHVRDRNKKRLYELLASQGNTETLAPKKLNKNNLAMIYINKSGLIALLCKSKQPNKCEFIKYCKKEFGISIENNSFLSKEQDTIGSITKAFSHLKFKRQFHIGDYKIDLYFPDKKIAIECDELGHEDRNIINEIERQKYIEKQLNCKFIRYNPDAEDFDIFKVINQIIISV